MGTRHIGRRGLAALGLTISLAAPASAQLFPATLPAHVIVDSCSGCSGALPANAAQETGGNLATLAGKDFATAAKQDTGNTSLASVKTNTDNLNLSISALRDAITAAGASAKTLNDLYTALGLLATAAAQTTGNGSLATLVTNTTPLVTAGAGGYVRQDSTATIAKESGGNLAVIAAAIDTPGTTAPTSVIAIGAIDGAGNTAALYAPSGVLQVQALDRGVLLPPCNPLRKRNCR